MNLTDYFEEHYSDYPPESWEFFSDIINDILKECPKLQFKHFYWVLQRLAPSPNDPDQNIAVLVLKEPGLKGNPEGIKAHLGRALNQHMYDGIDAWNMIYDMGTVIVTLSLEY